MFWPIDITYPAHDKQSVTPAILGSAKLLFGHSKFQNRLNLNRPNEWTNLKKESS